MCPAGVGANMAPAEAKECRPYSRHNAIASPVATEWARESGSPGAPGTQNIMERRTLDFEVACGMALRKKKEYIAEENKAHA